MKKILTQTSTITSKYQTVIPSKIRTITRLHNQQELIWQVIAAGDHPLIVVSPKPTNWSKHISGLGKHVWQGVDTDRYLKQLRAEWPK